MLTVTPALISAMAECASSVSPKRAMTETSARMNFATLLQANACALLKQIVTVTVWRATMIAIPRPVFAQPESIPAMTAPYAPTISAIR